MTKFVYRVKTNLTKTLSMRGMLLCGLFGFSLFFVIYQKVVYLEWDFAVYYTAAQTLVKGETPYDPSALMKTASGEMGNPYGGLPFLYMPLFARLLYPLTFFSYFEAAYIWFCLKCIALEFCIFAILSLFPIHRTVLNWGGLHLAALFFAPFSHDLTTGNIAIFESALLLGFFWGWRMQNEWLAAGSLIFCSIPKGIPLLLTFYPSSLRHKRMVWSIVIGVAVLGGLILFDFSAYRLWWTFYRGPEWASIWDDLVQGYYNCSSTSTIIRIFSDTYLTKALIPVPMVSVILIPLFPVSILILMAYGIKSQMKDLGFDPTKSSLIALLLAGFILLPPRMAGYTLSISFFPFCYVLMTAWKTRRWGVLGIVLISIGLIQVHLPPDHLPSGLPQLLIDKDFWGQFLLFLSVFLLCIRQKENTYKAS